MYIFDGHHSGGSSFVYVSVIKKKKKKGKESQYMVSRPETGSNPLIRSDRELGHDICSVMYLRVPSVQDFYSILLWEI